MEINELEASEYHELLKYSREYQREFNELDYFIQGSFKIRIWGADNCFLLYTSVKADAILSFLKIGDLLCYDISTLFEENRSLTTTSEKMMGYQPEIPDYELQIFPNQNLMQLHESHLRAERYLTENRAWVKNCADIESFKRYIVDINETYTSNKLIMVFKSLGYMLTKRNRRYLRPVFDT